MTAAARQVDGRVEVTVSITNTNVGHHVPTDHPGRHLTLTVRARDMQWHDLIRQAGSVVPAWGGAQAGQPGKPCAKVLQDVATGEAPVVSYWKQTRSISDNRLAALQSDTSIYAFAAPPAGGPIDVTAELRFRRAFQAVMDAKAWDTPDVVIEEAHGGAMIPPFGRLYLPLVTAVNFPY